jgi:hypothetical protein
MKPVRPDTGLVAQAVFLPFAEGAANRGLAGSKSSCAVPEAGVTRNQGAGPDINPAHNTAPISAFGRSMGPFV